MSIPPLPRPEGRTRPPRYGEGYPGGHKKASELGPPPSHDFGPGPVGKVTHLYARGLDAIDVDPRATIRTIDSGDLRNIVYWRVASFSKEWVDNEPGAPEPNGTTVSTRRVLKEVEKLLADKPWCITIQQQP